MNRKWLIAIGSIILLGAVVAAYVLWNHNHAQPEIVQVADVPTPPPAQAPASTPVPIPLTVIEKPAAIPLPQLSKSDGLVFDALAGLLSNQSLSKLFHTKLIIHKIVVTIVNLTQQRVPSNLLPFNPPPKHFLTGGSENQLTISPTNQSRYTSYVQIAEVTDTKKLVALYVRLYPLFQQSYEELGYRHHNFNDQLIETLDDLLETPDIKDPIKLIQPKYFYLFADPDLEALSIGQKIMLRLGNKNVNLIKTKLRQIKQELALNMIGSKLRIAK